jgi:5-(aminomethyl)-3-furanmethanol phosphate kinase
MRRRVIKVGGSLLTYKPLTAKLRPWLGAQPEAHNLLVVGGGGLTDAVRQWDQCFQFPPADSHWLCIRLMDISARALALLLPEANLLHDVQVLLALPPCTPAGCWILSPERFLREWEPAMPPPRLPADWSVTSDSIAARLAQAVQAEELVLLKSADPPVPRTMTRAAQSGYVDAFFPQAAERIERIRCVNLRQGNQYTLRSD